MQLKLIDGRMDSRDGEKISLQKTDTNKKHKNWEQHKTKYSSTIASKDVVTTL